MGYLLGIDLGSTSLKAVVFDENGKEIAKGSRPTQVEYLDEQHPKWAFWHPDHLWESVCAAIRQALAGMDQTEKILGIAVGGFGMDGVPMDEEDNWLYPFISWHCSRTAPQSKKLLMEISEEDIYNKTGKQVMKIDSINRIMWMNENQWEIMKKTHKWILVEDFINNRLCGSKTIDYSMAWSTAAFDIKEKIWDKDILLKANVDVFLLPDAFPSGTTIGSVSKKAAKLTGLEEGTPVILGGHDYICSAFAMGAFDDKSLLDVTGSWEMILSGSDTADMSPELFGQGVSVESHVVKGKYCTLASAVSSDMIEWFRKNFGYEEALLSSGNVDEEWKQLINLAQKAPVGSNGAMFLPHFCGAGSPVIDDESLGAFVGLNDLVDKGCMFRAMFEGLTYQMKDMIDAMEIASGHNFATIIVTGGAVKNDFWLQMKADVSNKEVVISDVLETSALGAALIAGVGIGLYKNEEEAFRKTYHIQKRYLPCPKRHAKYMELFRVYKKLHEALKEINAQIRRIQREK